MSFDKQAVANEIFKKGIHLNFLVFMDREKMIADHLKKNPSLSLYDLKEMFPNGSDSYLKNLLIRARKESLGFHGENTKKTERF